MLCFAHQMILMKNLNPLSLVILLLSLAALAPPAQSQSAGISGEGASARIIWNKTPYTLNPNQVGNFPTLDVPAQTPISVTVSYPAGKAGQAVSLRALEGGTLGNGKPTQDTTLDSQNKATFTFTTNRGRGLYRVAVGKGTDVKILEFWVGEKLPVYTE